MEVNDELKVLKASLEDALSMLKASGRISVITFHSIEDRLVKQVFRKMVTLDLPKDLPFVPEGYVINYRLINNKVIVPGEEELEENNRSHSAKLRIIERLK
jgi:16S rRNA (cytosine1402-N4)-methyltransferase